MVIIIVIVYFIMRIDYGFCMARWQDDKMQRDGEHGGPLSWWILTNVGLTYGAMLLQHGREPGKKNAEMSLSSRWRKIAQARITGKRKRKKERKKDRRKEGKKEKKASLTCTTRLDIPCRQNGLYSSIFLSVCLSDCLSDRLSLRLFPFPPLHLDLAGLS